MSPERQEWDYIVYLGLLVVFALPLTLLVPEFSIWAIWPKIRVVRCHVLSPYTTWPLLNAGIVGLLILLFCLFLELRKRKLDEMLEAVLKVNRASDATMEEEQERQLNTGRQCLNLFDESADHYEILTLLGDELRRRINPDKQHPPVIESSLVSSKISEMRKQCT